MSRSLFQEADLLMKILENYIRTRKWCKGYKPGTH